MSGYSPEESYRERVLEALDAINTRLAECVGDTREQLRARAYATGLDVALLKCQHDDLCPDEHGLRIAARRFADAAVRDFDEQYLGGKR